MIDYKVVLILAVIFHHNHGQIRSMGSHGGSNEPQGGSANAGIAGYRPYKDIRTMTNDPAEMFRLVHETRAEIKRDPSLVRQGLYFPRNGGTPMRLSGMMSPGNRFRYMPGTLMGEMEKLRQEGWERWVESRFDYPDDEEKNEYFKKFGSFPGAHYELSGSCTENITCPDYGFGTDPLAFIMDPEKVDMCPNGIDLSQGTPDYIVRQFDHDDCKKKHVKICHYCQFGEKQYHLAQFCLFNFADLGDRCENVQEIPLNGKLFERGWDPSAYHRFATDLTPRAGPNAQFGGGLPGLNAESYKLLDRRQETEERILTEDFLKVPNTNKVRHVTVVGHCSECII